MMVLDANILLHAWDSTGRSLPAHRNNVRLPGDRMTLEEAVEVVDGWVNHPNVVMLGPGPHHWRSLRSALIDGQAGGPLATDAQLAALTIEHGGILQTTDRDFTRFPGLRWENPLAP